MIKILNVCLAVAILTYVQPAVRMPIAGVLIMILFESTIEKLCTPPAPRRQRIAQTYNCFDWAKGSSQVVLSLVAVEYVFFTPSGSLSIRLYACGVAVYLCGVVLRCVAISTLGDNWAFKPVLLADAPRQVTRGIYGVMRHPAYIGNVWIVGATLALHAPASALVVAVMNVMHYVSRSTIENMVILPKLPPADGSAYSKTQWLMSDQVFVRGNSLARVWQAYVSAVMTAGRPWHDGGGHITELFGVVLQFDADTDFDSTCEFMDLPKRELFLDKLRTRNPWHELSGNSYGYRIHCSYGRTSWIS